MSDVARLTPTLTAPRIGTVGTAVGGLLLLGTASALGTGYVTVAVRTVPSAIVIAMGAAALTSPALLVAHQLMALKAPPEQVVAALGQGVVRLGTLCTGLTPFIVFFALTSGLAPVLYALVLVAACLLASLSTVRALAAVETRSNPQITAGPAMALLGAVCVGLTGLVALRLAVSVFAAVL
jgi:hypothetical protein